MNFHVLKLTSIFVFALLSVQNVHASLLVAPIRVAFEDRDRTQEVILINQSDKRLTYRLEWVERIANENGSYTEIDATTDFNTASSFIRFSPRQVTLEPGQRQVIKLLLRKPANLPKGEYRSHLKFVVIPPSLDEDTDNLTGGIAMKMHMFLSYTIPVIVRQGEPRFELQIGDIQQVEKNGKFALRAELLKQSDYSVSGNLVAFQSNDEEQKVVARLNNVNIFHEVSKRNAELILMDPSTPLAGSLTLRYEGIYENLGKTIAEKKVNIQ